MNRRNRSAMATKIASFTLTLVVALAASAAIAQARPTSPTRAVRCAVLTGVHWNAMTSGGRTSGNRYTVLQSGVGCAKALKFVPGLLKQKSGGGPGALKGPAGYSCASYVRNDNPHPIAGACHRQGSGAFFAWAPKLH